MGSVKQVNDDDWDADVLKSDRPILVDFWAPWCGPCLRVAPMIEELATEYAGRFEFAKINIDDNTGTAQKYRVSSIPTMIVFKGGQAVDRVLGALPKSDLKKFIDKNL